MERSICRIIDANFNRAREAVRLVEEFCRFALNCAALTARAKALRHQLCSGVGELELGRLITSRDTPGDVGAGQIVQGQLERHNLGDCLTAAARRLTEALRVLSETTQTIDPRLAKTFEQLRYTAYTLEKDIILFADASARFKRVHLYVIITSDFPADVLSLAQRCAAGGADCIQLRSKGIEDDSLLALACEFVQLCRDCGVAAIVNDRVDIAAASGADGVHLGQNDLPVEQARRLQITPLIIGKSTHLQNQLEAACGQLANYVSLGPVFVTATKPDARAVGLEYVTRSVELLDGTGIAHVAVGGITLDNVSQVLGAGAKAIAVCSAVTSAADPTSACRAFKEKIGQSCDC